MLVSIVTPSLNSEHYIEKTILSVKNQTYKKIEHTVVDGGSTDNTIDIVKKYPKVILIRGKDDGMYQAINKGLRIAKGAIFSYLNSDDLYFSDTIDFVVRYFLKYNDISCIYSDLSFIDKNDNYLYSYHYPQFDWPKYVAYNGNYIPQPTTFWRRQVHDSIGYFDENYKLYGDKDFFIRAGKEYRIEKVDKILAAQRLHHNSLTYKSNKRLDENLFLTVKQDNKLMSTKYRINRGWLYWVYKHVNVWFNIKRLNWPVYFERMLSYAKKSGI